MIEVLTCVSDNQMEETVIGRRVSRMSEGLRNEGLKRVRRVSHEAGVRETLTSQGSKT